MSIKNGSLKSDCRPFDYQPFCSGASTGQTLAHVPQPTHSSAFMTYFPSFSEMQLTGQLSAHVPQPMHLSGSILYVIIFPPFRRRFFAVKFFVCSYILPQTSGMSIHQTIFLKKRQIVPQIKSRRRIKLTLQKNFRRQILWI